MKIIDHRARLYAGFYGCFGLIAACTIVYPLAAQTSRAEPARAQRPALAPAAIGEIINEVLRVLVSPDDSLSGVPVAKRKVFFDLGGTMAAFGYPGVSTSLAALGIRRPVTIGSESLLSDCKQRGGKPCTQLGWSAFVSIEPLSITDSQVVVRAHVVWPDRGRTPFIERRAPTGLAHLTGFATEVYLARSATGQWRFLKEGVSIVGE